MVLVLLLSLRAQFWTWRLRLQQPEVSVLCHWSKQTEISEGKVRTVRWVVLEFPSSLPQMSPRQIHSIWTSVAMW
jgi:hypothetical protein